MRRCASFYFNSTLYTPPVRAKIPAIYEFCLRDQLKLARFCLRQFGSLGSTAGEGDAFSVAAPHAKHPHRAWLVGDLIPAKRVTAAIADRPETRLSPPPTRGHGENFTHGKLQAVTAAQEQLWKDANMDNPPGAGQTPEQSINNKVSAFRAACKVEGLWPIPTSDEIKDRITAD